MHTPSFKLVKDVFYALCTQIDTPVSLGMWLRFKHGEYHQLVTASLNPLDYIDRYKFRSDYLVVEYLSKYPAFDMSIDTKEVALQSFNNAEVTCRQTNHRLTSRRGEISPRVSPVLLLAQRKISRLLGDNMFAWMDLCKWGPGATATLSGQVDISKKLREKQISVTQLALPYLRAVMSVDLHWLAARGIQVDGPTSLLPEDFKVVEACRFTTVPKNAKTDRCIAIEPTGNSFLQGGMGLFIRSRLKLVGIDLTDQSRNQYAARDAVSNDMATVDLSSASDMISRELIWELFPSRWAKVLDDLRSHFIQFEGENQPRYLNKFSSMGNGFTFEVESLIFWALAQSVIDLSGLKVSAVVYGDDIIIPSKCLSHLVEVFGYVGFSVNKKKTHSNSLFRESCGEHYFDGLSCTPVYLRDEPKTMDRIILMHNQLYRLAMRWNNYPGTLDSRMRTAVKRILVDADTSLRVPYTSEGDQGLLSDATELHQFGPHGRKIRLLQPIPRYRMVSHDSLLAYWLRISSSNLDDYSLSIAVSFFLSYRKPRKTGLVDSKGRITVRGEPAYRIRKKRFFAEYFGEMHWI